ncbi:hypothetical protein AB0J86_23185 [Micromonospora sp. NPDC049559]|uniref:hypothetical protein n=1 Tax=Micromonospora sp. NPDC049559 TaxID=3155923 RepID=UPI00344684E1
MSDAHESGPRTAGGSAPMDLTAEPVDLAPEPIDITPGPEDDHRDSDELMPGFEEGEEERPAGRSRRRNIVLGSALVLGLAGAVVLGVAGWQVVREKDARLQTPPKVAGLARDDSERAKATADYLRNAFAADVDLDKSVGAIYSDPADAKRSVLLFGGTTLLWQPERDLDSLFDLVADDTGKVTDLHEVEAGELGGTMKCGTTATDEGALSVCGWADHGSVALAMFPGRTVDDSAALFRQIRATVQTRS